MGVESLKTKSKGFLTDPCRLAPGSDVPPLRGPCLSVASWSALLRLPSDPCNVAGRGVNSFGPFGLHNKGCALRAAPRSKLGCRAEPRRMLQYEREVKDNPQSLRVTRFGHSRGGRNPVFEMSTKEEDGYPLTPAGMTTMEGKPRHMPEGYTQCVGEKSGEIPKTGRVCFQKAMI